MGSSRYRAARQGLLVAALIFLVVAAVYRRAPTAFLRAESGLLLSRAFADDALQKDTVRGFFTSSYGGHYTPLAFWGEFTVAKIAGTSRAFWKWRQILAVSIVGAMLFGLVVMLTRLLGLPKAQQWAVAALLSSIILFQPAMTEFVTWPFMILQLAWIGLSAAALFFVVKTVTDPETVRWPWLACAVAYASVHVSGLGLVTVAGTAACLVFCAVRMGTGRLLRPCAVMLVLTVIHGAMMLQAVTNSSAMVQSTGILSAAKFGLGFIYNFALAGLRSLTFTSASTPHHMAIVYCWPLGLLLVVLLIAGMYRRLRETRADSTGPHFVTTLLLLFSATSFAAMVMLVAGRQVATGKDAYVVLPYLTVLPRYMIPLQFLLFGALVPALVWLARRAARPLLIACWMLVPVTVGSQLAYQQTAMPFLTIGTRASHHTSWQLLVAAARECRAAGLGFPNFSLTSLTKEFSSADVQTFLPLLRHDLRLAPNERLDLVPAASYLDDRASYEVAPSVKAFERKLLLGRD